MHEIGVIHGRFQPLHNDHMVYILAGWARCRRLVIGVTNPDPGLTRDNDADPDRSAPDANPFTYYQRYLMIQDALLDEGLDPRDFSIVPFPVNLPELYRYYVPLDAVFFLTIYDAWGRRKLELFQSHGLKTEVMWERPLSEKGITGAEIRRRMRDGEEWESLVPREVARLLRP